MKSIPRPALLAVAVFGVILFTQLPASWCRWALPAGVHCTQLSGSVWSGRCDGLSVAAAGTPAQGGREGSNVGDAGWALHPLQLLRGRLAVDLDLTRAGASARGTVALGIGGRIEARDVELRGVHLEQLPLSQLPRGLRGVLQARIAALSWAQHRVQSITGQAQVRDLAGATDRFGDYLLEFPANGPASTPDAAPGPVGTFRDIGGPLRVTGQLRLTPEPGFEVQALVAARPEASPGLTEQIQYLGSPDGQGMRPFSMAGTF